MNASSKGSKVITRLVRHRWRLFAFNIWGHLWAEIQVTIKLHNMWLTDKKSPNHHDDKWPICAFQQLSMKYKYSDHFQLCVFILWVYKSNSEWFTCFFIFICVFVRKWKNTQHEWRKWAEEQRCKNVWRSRLTSDQRGSRVEENPVLCYQTMTSMCVIQVQLTQTLHNHVWGKMLTPCGNHQKSF